MKVDTLETVWPLDNKDIHFGVKVLSKNSVIENGSEINLCYGERANSFLLVEYGFTIRDNRYDFVRIKNIAMKTILSII